MRISLANMSRVVWRMARYHWHSTTPTKSYRTVDKSSPPSATWTCVCTRRQPRPLTWQRWRAPRRWSTVALASATHWSKTQPPLSWLVARNVNWPISTICSKKPPSESSYRPPKLHRNRLVISFISVFQWQSLSFNCLLRISETNGDQSSSLEKSIFRKAPRFQKNGMIKRNDYLWTESKWAPWPIYKACRWYRRLCLRKANTRRTRLEAARTAPSSSWRPWRRWPQRWRLPCWAHRRPRKNWAPTLPQQLPSPVFHQDSSFVERDPLKTDTQWEEINLIRDI